MLTKSFNPDTHPVDLAVGANIRDRRRFLELSQEALAEAIGLTFQQVQKYERGTNRVSASKLFDIARALKCRPGDLMPDPDWDPQAVGDTWLEEATAAFHANPRLFTKLMQLRPDAMNAIERTIDVILALTPVEFAPALEAEVTARLAAHAQEAA